MIQPYKVPRQLYPPPKKRSKSRLSRWRLSWLIGTLILTLLICSFGLCTFGSTASLIIAFAAPSPSTSLPTFTPTSLPTFTPTPSPAEAAWQTDTTPQPIDSTFGLAATPLPTPADQSGSSFSPINNNGETSAVDPTAISMPTPPPQDPVVLPSPTAETSAPLPTATITKITTDSDWSFTNVRVDADQDEQEFSLYGRLINNSEVPQELGLVTGTFYDAQGQIIAAGDLVSAYWPGYVVPPKGGNMPFELWVNGIDSVANFDLSIQAETSNETPRQDFEFSEMTQWSEGDSYCVTGLLRNPDNALQSYLVIAVTLYDAQDNVINFNDEETPNPSLIQGDQAYNFEICLGPPNQEVARYQVEAWGW